MCSMAKWLVPFFMNLAFPFSKSSMLVAQSQFLKLIMHCIEEYWLLWTSILSAYRNYLLNDVLIYYRYVPSPTSKELKVASVALSTVTQWLERCSWIWAMKFKCLLSHEAHGVIMAQSLTHSLSLSDLTRWLWRLNVAVCWGGGEAMPIALNLMR